MAHKRRLKSLNDLRVFLSYVINEVHQGKLDPGIGSKIGYLVNILKGIIEANDLEQRVAELERLIKK